MRRIRRFNTDGFPVDIAAEITGPKTMAVDAFRQWGLQASAMALQDAGSDRWLDARRVGVIVGSALADLATTERHFDPNQSSPHHKRWSHVSLAHEIALKANAYGPCLMINASFASGADAIGIASQKIRSGALDIVIAGGSEAPISPTIVAGFASLGALASAADNPRGAIRPFDKHRQGCGLGEGAAFLVLEERNHAVARGASILAELIGYGASMDAFHITQLPANGDGLRQAMHLALTEARIPPSAIAYLNAHGTGTDMNDRIETAATRDVFGDHAYRLPMSSTKPVTGHLLGAAGALEAVITILAMQSRLVPPTINWVTRDPDCDLDYIPNVAREMDIPIAMTNSMGFGGHNASLILKRDQV